MYRTSNLPMEFRFSVVLTVTFCDNVQERSLGQRLNIIIVAEGAIDQDGKIITSDYVKDVSIHIQCLVMWTLCVAVLVSNWVVFGTL